MENLVPKYSANLDLWTFTKYGERSCAWNEKNAIFQVQTTVLYIYIYKDSLYERNI